MIGKKINQLATELAPASTDLTIIGNPTTGVSKKITLAQLGAIFSGAVSFYSNLASFPATGTLDVIFCAKDTKKLYLWSGSAYVEVFPSQALLDTYQLRSEKGVSNGYASLDSSGKVPISQLPSSIMEYKGTWSAATNTPTLANGTGDTGDVYLCNAAGTVNFGAGSLTFAVGDYVVYSGTIWQRSSGAVGTVTSVAVSRSGDALAITGSPITTSGTINIGFAGSGTQYIKGDGTLATFPSIISQAQNLVTEVYNKSGATITKGTVVYINGGQGNLPTIAKALATGDSTSAQTYGIVQADITNNNNGYVVAAGRLTDIDTQAYTEGTQLYLSSTTAGTYTSTKQYAPAHLVYVGIIVRSHPTQGVIEVKIQNGYELDEIHNVAAQTPTNNDGLFWESSTSLWKNKSIATILGYTPQAQLNGTGFVKASGTSITYDNSTYVTTDTFQTISASKTFSVGLSLASAGGTNQITSFVNTNSIHSGSTATNVLGFNNSNNIYFGKGLNNGGVITFNNAAVRFYALPDADGTIALVGGSGVGTVTSVAALTIGTSGTDLSSSVANGTTTPVITLNVPTASATNRGVLSAADWTKFNNNIPAGTPTSGDYVFYNGSNLAYRSFIANAPLSYNSSTATFSISQASGSANGYLSSTDWTTFNNKQNALTNPVTGSGTTNYLPKFTGASTIGNSGIYQSGNYIGIGTTSPIISLQVRDSGNTYSGHFSGNDQVNGVAIGTLSSNVAIIQGYTRTFSAINDIVIQPSGGNLGLGVSPSAWGTLATAFDIGTGGASLSYNFSETNLATNVYRINTGASLYKQNGIAMLYSQSSGGHAWQIAPSGTAGNAISFTQAMTLDASGRLFVGLTSGYSNGVTIKGASDDYALTIAQSNASNAGWGQWADTSGNYKLARYGGGSYSSPALTIALSGAATFSSSVTAGGRILASYSNTNGASQIAVANTSTSGQYTTAGIDISAYNGTSVTSGAGLFQTASTFSYQQIGANQTNLYGLQSGGIRIATVNAPIIFSNGSSDADFSTEKMRITSSGNVGIGTTSPTSKLHVVGLPTSSAGLTSGAIWNDGGTLKIV
jgi:hypothetical protein